MEYRRREEGDGTRRSILYPKVIALRARRCVSWPSSRSARSLHGSAPSARCPAPAYFRSRRQTLMRLQPRLHRQPNRCSRSCSRHRTRRARPTAIQHTDRMADMPLTRPLLVIPAIRPTRRPAPCRCACRSIILLITPFRRHRPRPRSPSAPAPST